MSRKGEMAKLDLSCQRKIEVTHLVTSMGQGKKSQFHMDDSANAVCCYS